MDNLFILKKRFDEEYPKALRSQLQRIKEAKLPKVLIEGKLESFNNYSNVWRIDCDHVTLRAFKSKGLSDRMRAYFGKSASLMF